MENNKNKKSVKFQGDMSNFCVFIQVFVFTRNHHLKGAENKLISQFSLASPKMGRTCDAGSPDVGEAGL